MRKHVFGQTNASQDVKGCSSGNGSPRAAGLGYGRRFASRRVRAIERKLNRERSEPFHYARGVLGTWSVSDVDFEYDTNRFTAHHDDEPLLGASASGSDTDRWLPCGQR